MLILCFFFQAEDGIRDSSVTGVQTCALPISPIQLPLNLGGRRVEAPQEPFQLIEAGPQVVNRRGRGQFAVVGKEPLQILLRSEERRVGEEGRSRWSPDH